MDENAPTEYRGWVIRLVELERGRRVFIYEMPGRFKLHTPLMDDTIYDDIVDHIKKRIDWLMAEQEPAESGNESSPAAVLPRETRAPARTNISFTE